MSLSSPSRSIHVSSLAPIAPTGRLFRWPRSAVGWESIAGSSRNAIMAKFLPLLAAVASAKLLAEPALPSRHRDGKTAAARGPVEGRPDESAEERRVCPHLSRSCSGQLGTRLGARDFLLHVEASDAHI